MIADKELGLESIKVADFGLAKQLQTEGGLASTTCGTPGYVAPEILKEEKYGKACDYWSVGIVVFVLLSGTSPFYEEDNFLLFESIKKCKWDFESDTWDSVSAEAKDFVSKILVADPDKRLTFA